MLKKIVSGGQTGADKGGLIVARRFDLETGGWVPKGCRTEDGPDLELIEVYNCEEHPSSSYYHRTLSNAHDSDATIILSGDFESKGTKLTIVGCQHYDRPFKLVDVKNPCDAQEVVDWLQDNNVEILNVAGNRASRCEGVGQFTEDFLGSVFETILGKN